MRGRGLINGATGIGLVGLALLVFEATRALRSIVLGTTGTAVLFVGLGLVVVAGVLVVVSLGVEPSAAAATPAAQSEPAAQSASITLPATPAPLLLPAEPAVLDLTDAPAPPASPAPAPPRRAPASAPAGRSALATLRAGGSQPTSPPTRDEPALTISGGDRVSEADAADWTLLCRADGAGRLEAGTLSTSVRRGATLTAYREGVLLGIGKIQRHQSWAQIATITAELGGGEARISVRFANGDGLADATFTGKNGDLAPVATALVSAAPAGVVAVSYA